MRKNALLTGFLFCLWMGSTAQITVDQDAAMEAILQRITLPNIPNYSVSVTEFGAKADDDRDDKRAFDKAMRACSKKGGGTIVVPKGLYVLNGPIRFESNIELHLEEGALIRFTPEPKYYLPMVATSWEGTMLYNYSPLIYAKDKKNIAITGKGVIDGEGSKIWLEWKPKDGNDKTLSRKMNHESTPIESRKFGEGSFLRPHLLQFFNCENILVEGVRFEDAPFWTTHYLKSKSITIKNISFNAHNPNNDGIDLEYSSDVLIEGVDFDNSDDNVAIKAGRDHEGRANQDTPSQNIVVRNCRFKGLHALVIGSEMSAGVKNVFVVNNEASGYLKRGIYFKTNSDRGGYIKDIYINDLKLKDTEDGIFMTANYHGEGSGNFASKISDITISNVTCDSASNTAIVVEGYPTRKAENIIFDTIKIKSAKNGMTLMNTRNITVNEIVIGEQAGTPSAAN